jgi:hypothetical protein
MKLGLERHGLLVGAEFGMSGVAVWAHSQQPTRNYQYARDGGRLFFGESWTSHLLTRGMVELAEAEDEAR